MLLTNISEEFVELKKVLEGLEVYNDYNRVLLMRNMDIERITMENMLKFISITRDFVSQKYILESHDFKSSTVKQYIREYLDYLDGFAAWFDEYMDKSIREAEKSDVIHCINNLKYCSEKIYNVLTKISNASEIIEMVSSETWEPLPPAIKEDKYENVTILSETKSVSLSSISKDISTLDNFLNNISSLIKEAKGNNFYLRKVESGSLAVVISCIAGASQIVSFIFFYIKLCQNTEKRELKNEERKLEIINKSLDTAKKILELDPQNTEANEIVQRCGLYILEFLENNPKGTINNQSYDIGAEKLKIEEKKED